MLEYDLIEKLEASTFVEIHSTNERITLLEFTEHNCREHIIKDDFSAIPYLSSALFRYNNQTAVPIIKLADGTEMRLADWRAQELSQASIYLPFDLKQFKNFNKDAVFGLICDVAYLAPTNYSAIDSLLKNSRPEEKQNILGVIAEVVKAYPEQSKGYLAHLMNDKSTGVSKKEVDSLIEVGASAEKGPKTDLEIVLEKHPKAFARAFLKVRDSRSDNEPEIHIDKLSIRELKHLNKITYEIANHTGSKFDSIIDGIKDVINSFIQVFSKNAGLSNEAFQKALDDIDSRSIQSTGKEQSALKAILDERAKSEQNVRGK